MAPLDALLGWDEDTTAETSQGFNCQAATC
jgi:hypothetical protein